MYRANTEHISPTLAQSSDTNLETELLVSARLGGESRAIAGVLDGNGGRETHTKTVNSDA